MICALSLTIWMHAWLSWSAALVWKAVKGLAEVLLIPGDAAIDAVHSMFGFPETMPFARIADHHSLDAHVPESHVELFSFCDRNVVVVFAMHEHGGSVRGRHMLKGRAFP